MPKCPQCEVTVPLTARFCPACGATLTDFPTATSPAGEWRGSAPVESGRPAGTILAGRYRIVGLLGRGGMGEVYRADDLKLGQPVALKFLPAAVENDAAALARFHSEVRVARQVSHANVCRIYDIGEADGQHFLSMEYVDGEDLASLLRRIGRLPPDKAIEIAHQLCAGVAAAHEAGVLHRDLKPANVMLDGRGRVKITDFGLAEAVEHVSPNEIAGTPAYIAPEQLRGSPPSVRSDVYALGLVLYRSQPFNRECSSCSSSSC
jgi:serine/threonine-protein kinase